MKLLIIGLNYAPEEVGIGPYTAGMARGLAERGHPVQVVAGQPYYPQWQRRPGTASWRARVEGGVRVMRCPHYVPRKPTGARRVVHLASFSISALLPALAAARRLRPKVVLVVAPALLSVPVGWLAAKMSRAKLWVHVQDFEVEAAFATGLMQGGGIAARLARGFEQRLLRCADRVSTIGPKMIERLVDKGIPGDRIVEIRNWASEAFAPDAAEAARYRAEWSLGERHVALYSGNIANKQGIEIVIEAAQSLRHREDIVFVICGDGPNRARLAQLAAGLPNFQLHSLQPAERMGGLLALASVHLLPQIPGAADLVLPSKLTNMLGSGRPIIATAAPTSGLAAEVEGCGVITPPGDAAALAHAVAALIDDPAQRARLGKTALERAAERWSRRAVIDRLENALSALVAD